MCMNHHKRKQLVLFNSLFQDVFIKYLLVLRTALGTSKGVFNMEPIPYKALILWSGLYNIHYTLH